MDAEQAARAFLAARFDGCRAAFLGGSTVRGDATATSDLDIVVVNAPGQQPYRESLHEFGWPIEVFVHNTVSLQQYFQSDLDRRRPSLLRMCIEGILLRDVDGLGGRIKADARAAFDDGPSPLSESESRETRYFLTDALDDFLGSTNRAADFLLAGSLIADSANLILASARRWQGKGKWVERSLREYDPAAADRMAAAIEAFQRGGDKALIVAFVDHALDLAGGRFWEGYSVGKQ